MRCRRCDTPWTSLRNRRARPTYTPLTRVPRRGGLGTPVAAKDGDGDALCEGGGVRTAAVCAPEVQPVNARSPHSNDSDAALVAVSTTRC
jgi:hypothetical protein